MSIVDIRAFLLDSRCPLVTGSPFPRFPPTPNRYTIAPFLATGLPLMQKTDVEAALAEQLGISKTAARDLLNVMLDEITLAMSRGQRIALPGFGIFEVRAYGPRKGRNPQTGEPLDIPAGHAVHFKPGKALKDSIG